MGSSALVRQLVLEKENSEFKPVKLRLKIYLVSYPARAEGLGKYGSSLFYTVVATDLFPFANQCPRQAIRLYTDQSPGRAHWFLLPL